MVGRAVVSLHRPLARSHARSSLVDAPPVACSGLLSENSDDDDDDGFEIIDTADDVTKSVDSSDGQSQASGGMTSATSGDTKSPAPRKPPPPKVVRTSGGAGVSKYVYQGQDFKASPEGAAVNGVAAAAEPSAPPRRKHVTHAVDAKKDDTDKASPLVIDASPVATSVKMEASPQMVPPAAKTSKAPAKAESVTESASAKIEASPQMTPPSPVVKAMEKRSATTTAPPERPHERPGERASLVGSRTPPSTTTTVFVANFSYHNATWLRFDWLFADGDNRTGAGLTSVEKTFDATGSSWVQLELVSIIGGAVPLTQTNSTFCVQEEITGVSFDDLHEYVGIDANGGVGTDVTFTITIETGSDYHIT